MQTKIVFQLDRAGLYLGETVADESPLEPGVFLMPARTIAQAPPASWPDDKWPRWNGATWDMVTRAQSAPVSEQLSALLAKAADLQAEIVALQAAQAA